MSTFFPSSRNFSVNGGHFSHVGGDQHNHYNHASTSSAEGQMLITQGESSTTMTVHVNGDQINQIVQQKEKERTKFDDVSGSVELADGGEAKILRSTQFRNVRQGDFCQLRDISIIRYLDCQLCMLLKHQCCKCEKLKVDMAICLAEVDGSPGKVYTAVSYSGPDARKVFEADFQTYSGLLSSQVVQIYAIDIGTVPTLLLRNELVPFAHFEKHVARSVRLHLRTLVWQWQCVGWEVWIDSARGVICRGPAGPDSRIWGRKWCIEMWDIPSTVDFLQEDVVLRFIASKKSREVDGEFIGRMTGKYRRLDYVPELINSAVVLGLSDTPIAIAACHHRTWNYSYNLLERTLLENGLCRFRLDDVRWFRLWWGLGAQAAWMSQAWSIFHTLGITIEDDLEAFVFTSPHVKLSGSPSRSEAKRQRRLQQSIYLFVRPLPAVRFAPNDRGKFGCKTPLLHYWSFRKDGDSTLSRETCHYLGLPTILHLTCHFLSSPWSTHDYKTIHQYQLLRGFDPKTTDFARHLGFDEIVFQPILNSAQIEEIHEEQNSGQPSDFHFDFVVYDSDGHTSDSDGDFATDFSYFSDSSSDSSTDSDNEPSSESESGGLSNTLEQGQLVDLASTSSFQAQDVREHEFATNLDGGASKRQRTGAGYRPRAERHDHLDQTPTYLHHKNDTTTDNQAVENPGEGVQPICPLLRRSIFSTDPSHQAYWSTDTEVLPAGCTDLRLSASQGLHSLSSPSIDPSWVDVLFCTPPGMATVLFHPAQPLESLSMSRPALVATSYDDAVAELGSVYANQSIHSVGPSNTAFISDTSEYAGWSRSQFTPFAATSSSLYDAPRFDTPAVGIQRSNVEWSNTRNYTPSSTAPDNSFHDTSTFDTASTVSSSVSSRIATIPFQLAQPVGPLRISQPESVATCYEGAGAEPGSVYANPSIDSGGPSNTTSISDTSEYAGWWSSRPMPTVATSSSLYNAPGLDAPAVSFPFSHPTAQTHLHSPSQAEPADGLYSESSTPYHSGGLAAIQQQSSPHVSATSSSYGQSGLPATNGIWNDLGDFDLGNQGYE
ncbi:hypothetical protein PQX77_019337 [Marasmius sp. AFHP31]|nr:hypothetical protein PQX77_019337 [Marasmius sp. AFHP31]